MIQALRKEPMTVYGDGKQTRSFQFVSDLVSFSLLFSTIPFRHFIITHGRRLARAKRAITGLSPKALDFVGPEKYFFINKVDINWIII